MNQHFALTQFKIEIPQIVQAKSNHVKYQLIVNKYGTLFAQQ